MHAVASTPTTVERRVLWATVEDFVGLWEVGHVLAGSCPEVPEEEREAVARATLDALLERGLIRVWRRQGAWGRPEVLADEAARAALAEAANWQAPPLDALHLLVASSPAGQSVFSEPA